MAADPSEMQHKVLENDAFRAARVRIEKSHRIKEDLKPSNGNPYDRERVQELRNIEMRSEQGQAGKESGLEELVLDTRGYQEHRLTQKYLSPDGKSEISEQLVFFVKMSDKGQPEWLRDSSGNVLALNGELYDSRLSSQKRAQGSDYDSKVILRVDGRGAYTGVVTLIEPKSTSQTQGEAKGQIAGEPSVAATPEKPAEQQTRTIDQLTQIPLEKIGNSFRLNEANPPKPDTLLAPLMGNMYGEDDTPTLAGKAIASVYEQLVERPGYVRSKSAQEAQAIIAQDKLSRERFTDYVKAKLTERWQNGNQSVTFSSEHESGRDEFHFNGEGWATKDHELYFNKSHANWKNPNEPEVRAYLTLSPKERDLVQEYFVDLALQLYDSGIDFSAKSSGAAGLAHRTDNMVFYIAASEQAGASEIIKKYMTDRNIGQGHVMAAIPSPQEGLSWAMEPNGAQDKVWQEVTGSSKTASFNGLVTAYAIPTYLERLALANLRKSDTVASETFKKEASRVRQILYRPPAQP